jgi:hypothetical protein
LFNCFQLNTRVIREIYLLAEEIMTTEVFDVITDVKEYFFRITGYLPKLKEQVTKNGSGGQSVLHPTISRFLCHTMS